MPRRTKPRYNTQKAKHLKRPRSWHRKSKKPIWELWQEIRRLQQRQKWRRMRYMREVETPESERLEKGLEILDIPERSENIK